METPLPLSAGPRGQTKHNIVSAFFGPESDQAQSRQGEFTEFFQSYSAKLRQLRIGAISDSWEINKLAAQSHDDVLRICRLLADKKHLKRAEIRNILYASFSQAEEKAVDMSIDLAIRLWLMINVRDDELSVNEPSKSSAQWADQETLQDLTYRLFPVPKTNLTIKEARLGPTFNAAYLSDICGLEFYWTDNLQDHLLLHRRTRTLHIFADQGFLFGHLNATACNSGCGSLLPASLLEDTIKSLDLLFPQWEKSTQRLLRREEKRLHHYPSSNAPRWSLQDFTHWRVRLLEVHEEVYLAPPGSLKQLWADHRHPESWYVFWIGVVVLVLSLVSCVASIIQAWAAIKSMHLGQH